MKKENIKWFMFGLGVNKEYSIEGTELDRELVDAFFNMDKIKCLELLQKGADINVSLTIKSNGETVACGPLFQHLIGEKPWKAKTAQMNKEIEAINRSNHYNQYLSSNDRGRVERLKQSIKKEIASTKSHNEKREKEIVDFAEFWLDIGGGRPLVVGTNYHNALDLDKIEYPKVREYIERATEVDRAVQKKMVNERIWGEKGAVEKFYFGTTIYRTSNFTIDEIKEKVQTDPNLSSNAEMTM